MEVGRGVLNNSDCLVAQCNVSIVLIVGYQALLESVSELQPLLSETAGLLDSFLCLFDVQHFLIVEKEPAWVLISGETCTGPGCSSVGGGMLSELGPFYPTPNGRHLLKNPYSWNKGRCFIFLRVISIVLVSDHDGSLFRSLMLAVVDFSPFYQFVNRRLFTSSIQELSLFVRCTPLF